MRWFFAVWIGTVAVFVLCAAGWIATRESAPELNLVFGKVMLYDLGAIGVVMSYVLFVGAWHIWERLTGRMELESQRGARTEGSSAREGGDELPGGDR